MYIKAFVKIYNWQNKKLIDKTHEIIKFEKYSIFQAEKFLNLGGQKFCKKSEILQSAYVIPRNIENNTFYFIILLTKINSISYII